MLEGNQREVGRNPVILAPFANERLREWPVANFRRFVELGLKEGYRFGISGVMAHRSLANEIARGFPADKVNNLCGRTSWSEMQSMLEAAPFVVANNSGIAHLAASLDTWLLCLFGGRHAWEEWMPRGRRVVTLARTPPCSPCNCITCPNDFDCLTNLSAEFAFREMMSALRKERMRSGGIAAC